MATLPIAVEETNTSPLAGWLRVGQNCVAVATINIFLMHRRSAYISILYLVDISGQFQLDSNTQMS